VVDLRGLNKLRIPDAYPMPLQQDVIESLRGMNYISCVDASVFFYQFWLNPAHRERLTIISHRGQEIPNVLLMGYGGSPQYTQRFMDKKLREFKRFCKCFVDDVVIFSKTWEEHLLHLRTIFNLFLELRIWLAAPKSYLAYPSVELLGHHVNGFGMATSKARVQAIKELLFPATLQKLETFIRMTRWLRQFVPFYTKVIEPL